MSVTTKTIKELTYVRTIQKLKNCCGPLKILEAAYLLLLILLLLFTRKKKRNAFSWTKNTARGLRFLLVLNMYLFLAQCEQVILFLALAPLETLRIYVFLVWLDARLPEPMGLFIGLRVHDFSNKSVFAWGPEPLMLPYASEQNILGDAKMYQGYI